MARPGRPNGVWWRASHKRWCYSIQGKQYHLPKHIGPNDRKTAELYHREAMAALYPDMPTGDPLPRTGRVGREYRIKVSTVRRLKRLVRLRREATGKPSSPARVIDELVERESRATRAAKAD